MFIKCIESEDITKKIRYLNHFTVPLWHKNLLLYEILQHYITSFVFSLIALETLHIVHFYFFEQTIFEIGEHKVTRVISSFNFSSYFSTIFHLKASRKTYGKNNVPTARMAVGIMRQASAILTVSIVKKINHRKLWQRLVLSQTLTKQTNTRHDIPQT